MRRAEVRIRRTSAGLYEVRLPGRAEWQTTSLSADMTLGKATIPRIRDLLDVYMADDPRDYLHQTDWALRIEEQRRIGTALWRGAFGPNVDFDAREWLHIVPELSSEGDDDLLDLVCRMPWTLLTGGTAAGAPFLARGTSPVAITVDAGIGMRGDSYDILLPSKPRVLLIMPEVKPADSSEDTKAAAHRERLVAALNATYGESPHNVRYVRSFQEFDTCIRNPHGKENGRFDPHILYFYGHGFTRGKGTEFQFEADEKDGKPNWKAVNQIADILDGMVAKSRFPPFVFFNACLGAAAAQDSALRLFARSASCVAAMRTVVRMDASRTIAEIVLPSVVVHGLSPPVAFREMMPSIPTDWLQSGHWASTVIACQFRDWTALGHEEKEATYHDAVGNFPLRIDRSRPLLTVEARLARHFGEKSDRPRPAVVIWKGAVEQSPDKFEKRVRDLLIERFPAQIPVFFRVELQENAQAEDDEARDKSFQLAVVKGLADSPAAAAAIVEPPNFAVLRSRIANLAPGRNGVFVLLHGCLQGPATKVIAAYIGFWEKLCAGFKTLPNAPHIVLVFGFFEEDEEIEAPAAFEKDMLRLGTVPRPEIERHLARYLHFYDIGKNELRGISKKLEDESAGRLSTLLDALNRMAGIKPDGKP